MDRILTNGRKLLTSNNNKLLVSRERTTGQRSGLRLNGTTNKITIPAQTLTDFTFSTWFRKDASKTSSFLSNSGANILGLNASNQLTFLGLAAGISYSIHKTWSYLVVTREAGVVKASLNKGAFVTIGTDATSVTVNELGNLFDGRLEAPALFNIANGAHKPHNYLESSAPNLIEQWKLNEGVGNVVYGTKGNNGTITGTATWTTPSLMNYVGKCVRFNGTNHISCGKAYSLGLRDMTISFWLKTTESTGNKYCVSRSKSIAANHRFGVGYNNGKVRAFLSTGPTDVLLDGDKIISDGLWHHITIVIERKSNMSIYVDGVFDKSTIISHIASIDFTTDHTFRIGSYSDGNDVANYLMIGSLDEVRVWNIARTQTEIQDWKDRTMGRHPNLVLNMGFESDYYDASGYGNHGTPVGSPALEVTDNDKLLLNAPIN
jgi:hypothetical protein